MPSIVEEHALQEGRPGGSNAGSCPEGCVACLCFASSLALAVSLHKSLMTPIGPA
jgi:hypothetical protein